jgi:hypothetical protein
MANTDIFLGSGTSITFIPENDIYVGGTQTGGGAFDGTSLSSIDVDSAFTTNFLLVNNLYTGCLIERYNGNNAKQSTHRIQSNTSNAITFTPSVAPISGDYFVIKSYGAPVPAPLADTTVKRLLADEWLGITETVSFPTTEIENKPVNLSLGGTRNMTYQYKGITSFSGGSIGIVANHGAWLYYFLGKCTNVNATASAVGGGTPSIYAVGGSADNNKIFIEGTGVSGLPATVDIAGVSETGPLFHRTNAEKFNPPVSPHLNTLADMITLTRPSGTTSITDAITYTFAEQNGDLLPSFALEQSFSKLHTSTNTFRTGNAAISLSSSATTAGSPTATVSSTDNLEVGMFVSSAELLSDTRILTIDSATQITLNRNAAKTNASTTLVFTQSADKNFIQIARGNRVNTLSITANENEEVKMTLEVNTRNVHSLERDESYDARAGVSNETTFFNYESSTNSDEMREPFFFSDGTFKVLGQDFLKIASLTLTMNNNLADKRFLGVGNKNIQEAIPAQRTYEIQFTGHVTDNALYEALLNDSEDNHQTIELKFAKANGEEINLTFTDYFITANNFPIAEDKGPIAVEATVTPRNLGTCTVKTHWVLQG